MDSQSDFLRRLAERLGPQGLITDPDDMAPYLAEERGAYRGQAIAVARPRTADEAAFLVAEAARASVPIVPQGGNTGLVGGAVAAGGLVLSLARLDRIRGVDPFDRALTAEAGVTLKAVQDAALAAGCLFPLSLGSEGTARIGGLVSTNAGGTAVLRYGNMRELVLGLEAVLPDGRIWNGLKVLRKDNAGYDLKQLFIGSEGTLGIVTAAVLRLFPQPRSRAAAFVGLATPQAALLLLKRMQDAADDGLTGFELLPSLAIELVLQHMPGTVRPLANRHAWYVLVELSSPREADLAGLLEGILAESYEAAETADAAVAASEAQRTGLWRLREVIPEARRRDGASINHDVSVPVSRIPDFLDRGLALAERAVPGVRACPFGHMGDGNIHFNLGQPPGADPAVFLAERERLNRIVHDLVHELGGSIAAEHGIGLLKRDELARYADPVALDLMRTLKRALDPAGLLNPGKVVPEE
jgi:FAD/FMN-containing dehydrogenase